MLRLLLVLLLSPAASGQTADSLLSALLLEHRAPIALEGDRLTGPGALWLTEEAQAAQFVMLGEVHGIAEVPALTLALLHAMGEPGPVHLVVETGPHTAARLAEEALQGRGALERFNARYPLGVPFFNMHEEMDLLVAAVGAGVPVWGVDQEFIGSPRIWWEVLEQRAPSPAARGQVHALRQAEAAAVEAALAGNPGGLFLMSDVAEPTAALRAAFAGDAEAVAIIEALAGSALIYRTLMVDRAVYASNDRRARLMRRTFLDHYRRARAAQGAPPRAVLKFGFNHLLRGRNLIDVFDLGNLVAELATVEGGRAFNLVVLAGPGSEVTGIAPGRGFYTQPSETIAEPWAAPLVDALDPSAWTLFDLRPLRAPLQAGRIEPEEGLADLIWGFDGALVLVGSTPAAFTPIVFE